jgi:hypothetical protein
MATLSPFSATWKNDVVKKFADTAIATAAAIANATATMVTAASTFGTNNGILLSDGTARGAKGSTATISSTGAPTFPARLTTKMLNLGTGSSKTIAAGVITLAETDSSRVIVDTEASAATDGLATINGGVEGDLIIMRSAASTRDVVLHHLTGNIQLATGADTTLDTNNRLITLLFTGALWQEVSRNF